MGRFIMKKIIIAAAIALGLSIAKPAYGIEVSIGGGEPCTSSGCVNITPVDCSNVGNELVCKDFKREYANRTIYQLEVRPGENMEAVAKRLRGYLSQAYKNFSLDDLARENKIEGTCILPAPMIMDQCIDGNAYHKYRSLNPGEKIKYSICNGIS